jgi:16S rRNA (guanine(966)-N(2))-methyltransferase RsmD
VRIISGKNKGRKIIAPNKLPVRPTTDFAKEALFNILGNLYDFQEMEVLDLFAGTGNISYEFISRNAKNVVAVDNNHACIKFIQQMANKLNYTNLHTIQSDYKAFIQHTVRSWDLIFADPPYEMSDVLSMPLVIFEKNLLNPGGVLVVEHKGRLDFSEFANFTEHRNYGNVNFSFFSAKNN